MQHNALIKREEKIYEFEEKAKFKANIDSLKALGLAFMYAANPKLNDTENELHEMFVMDKLPIDIKDNQTQTHTSYILNAQDEQSQLLQKNQKEDPYLDNRMIREQIRKESGFQFHNVLKQETETHQDCLCSLARHIGHTERSFQQYHVLKQLWNIQRNQDVRKNKEDAKRDEIINKTYK